MFPSVSLNQATRAPLDSGTKMLVGFETSNDTPDSKGCQYRTFGAVTDECGVTFGTGSAGPPVCPR